MIDGGFIMTIISEFVAWTLGTAASGVVGNLTYEGVKGLYQSYREKFSNYYQNEEEMQQHFEIMAEATSNNPNKPQRDVEDSYEVITQRDFDQQFVSDLKTWVLENQIIIKELVQNKQETTVISVGSQYANGNIYNIGGDQNNTFNFGKEK